MLLAGIRSEAQLHAAFSATPVQSCSPAIVNFTDHSTGNPTSWQWDLGNGTISYLQNPSTTYFTPGSYTIKLTVYNDGGMDSLQRIGLLQVAAQPSVDFSSNILSGCSPLTTQFTDQSNAGTGNILSWEWDFGDGNISNLQNPSHTYLNTGYFNVSLRIMNSSGCIKTFTRNQYVQVTGFAHAAFQTNSTGTCGSTTLSLNYQNTSTGSGTLQYHWEFGDGISSSLANPGHVYSGPGIYPVTLIATNNIGCTDTITRNISVGQRRDSIAAPDTACANVAINFMNASLPVPLSCSWNFGNGQTSTLINPTITYTATGPFLVTLINNFGECRDTVYKIIQVISKPIPSFTVNRNTSCKVPFTVQFNNTTVNGVSYKWNFGDNSTSTLASPSHTYVDSGFYTVTLVATNSNGCVDSLVMEDFISIELPYTYINDLPAEGCTPFSWHFTSAIISNDPVTSYLWNFGDGTSSNQQSPTHVYTAGTYDVQLIITTSTGCMDSVTVTDSVRVGYKPHANFNAPRRFGCARNPIRFYDLSTGNVDRWLWDFGDGDASIQQNPDHVYQDTGYFTVTLVVWNNGCTDTIRFVNYIYITPPVARFGVSFNCTEPLKRVFTDHSIGADQWSWTFGDGATSNLQSPVHVYATQGLYSISLRVWNNVTGCDFVRSLRIRVVDERTDFSISDSIVCKRDSVTFNALAEVPANLYYCKWSFGDGTTGTGATIKHAYLQSGHYTITLYTMNVLGCKDTLVKTALIRVNGPTADFAADDLKPCRNSLVNYSDGSTSDGNNSIHTWIWNYGDGVTDTLHAGPFQHMYQVPGIFTVSLTVVDSAGCSTTKIKPRMINIANLVSAFRSPDTLACPNTTIHFYSNPTGESPRYVWHFGDGTTSTLQNPAHQYTADGEYTVMLITSDTNGCADTLTKTNYIKIVTPFANFMVSDTAGTCPPLIVNFTNQSSNVSSMSWDFGDGTSSQALNPSHFYNTPGSFIAKLTVMGPNGCSSVKQQVITVNGPRGTFTYGNLHGCDSLTVHFRAVTENRTTLLWDFNDGNTIATNDSVISHTYTSRGFYLPKLILRNDAGCIVPVTGIDTIKVLGVTAGFQFNNPLFCNGGLVQFSNSSASNDQINRYEWSFADGGTSNIQNPSHQYNGSGMYYPTLKVYTQFGCMDSLRSPIPIRSIASPQASIAQTTNGCAPLTIQFGGSITVPDTSSISWHWDLGNGHVSTQMNPDPVIYEQAGTYPVQLIVSNSNGCTDTLFTQVQSYAIPVINSGADTSICKGNGKTLNATGATSYTWSPSNGLSCIQCANPVATPDSATIYTVTGTDLHGCKGKDSVNVKVVYPFQMRSSGEATICAGKSVNLFANGAYSYEWSPTDGLNNALISHPLATPGNSVVYRVIGTDRDKCFRDTGFIPVKVFPVPTVEAGENKTVNVGQALDLKPVISSDVNQVNWSPTGSIFRSTYPDITIKPKETTIYTVEVSNAGGCQAKDQLTVHVICNGNNVFIPNTFSPNGDGVNEIFYPRGSGLFTIRSMRIFNRWGEVVYEKNNFSANDKSAGWDGRYKGQQLNSDAFVYMIEIICDNNNLMVEKGNVMLMR